MTLNKYLVITQLLIQQYVLSIYHMPDYAKYIVSISTDMALILMMVTNRQGDEY